MKRIKVRPGKYVTVSAELAEKVEAIGARLREEFSREKMAEIIKAEPRNTTAYAGERRPKYSRRFPKVR